MRLLIALFCCAAFAQSPPPTKAEIEHVLPPAPSKGGTLIGMRLPRTHKVKIRTWAVRFKERDTQDLAGYLRTRWDVEARNGDTCADYLVARMIPIGPAPQPALKTTIDVSSLGTHPCR
jgi:hypothetical protein